MKPKTYKDFLNHINISASPSHAGQMTEKNTDFNKLIDRYLSSAILNRISSEDKNTSKRKDQTQKPLSESPRKRSINRKINYNKKIDLHGMYVNEALAELTKTITEMRRKHEKTILIITGKGLHSDNGPVIRDSVYDFLKSRSYIRKIETAPPKLGGSGAFIAEIQTGKKNKTDKL